MGRLGRYFPADIVQWTRDTELCDLNKERYPERSLLLCDTSVLLGVVEYLHDPALIFGALSRRTIYCLATYSTIEAYPARWDRWLNAFSKRQFVNLVASAGWVIGKTANVPHHNQLLVVLQNPKGRWLAVKKRIARQILQCRVPHE
jgi:hypothetical protein